jgi:hypothetical protein
LKGAKSCEVILLESDDSTVFSDEDDADEEEEDNAGETSHSAKLPLPLPTSVMNKTNIPHKHTVTKKVNQPTTTNIQLQSRQCKSHPEVKPNDPRDANHENREEKKHTIKRGTSPYSEPPVLKVEGSSGQLEVAISSALPHPPSLPIQRSESSHSSRRSEKKKKKKKKKSKSEKFINNIDKIATEYTKSKYDKKSNKTNKSKYNSGSKNHSQSRSSKSSNRSSKRK